MSLFTLIFLIFQAAANDPSTTDGYCRQQKSQMTQLCQATEDLLHGQADNAPLDKEHAIFSVRGSDCKKSLQAVTFTLSQVPESRFSSTPHLKCTISQDFKNGSSINEFNLSLGTSMRLEVGVDANKKKEKVRLIIKTPEGELVCDKLDTTGTTPLYQKCKKKLKGQTGFNKISDVTTEQISQLLANKLILSADDKLNMLPEQNLRPALQ